MSDTIFGLVDKKIKRSPNCGHCGRYTGDRGGGTCDECREEIRREQELYRERRLA